MKKLSTKKLKQRLGWPADSLPANVKTTEPPRSNSLCERAVPFPWYGSVLINYPFYAFNGQNLKPYLTAVMTIVEDHTFTNIYVEGIWWQMFHELFVQVHDEKLFHIVFLDPKTWLSCSGRTMQLSGWHLIVTVLTQYMLPVDIHQLQGATLQCPFPMLWLSTIIIIIITRFNVLSYKKSQSTVSSSPTEHII